MIELEGITGVWPATKHDVAGLIDRLRISDVDELAANARLTGKYGPGWSLRRQIELDLQDVDCWAMVIDGELAGLGGIHPLPEDPRIGAIWFLGTDLADTHWRTMTRLCRKFLSVHAPDYKMLGNIVPTYNEQRLRWLKYLGFDFDGDKAQLKRQGYVAFWLHP